MCPGPCKIVVEKVSVRMLMRFDEIVILVLNESSLLLCYLIRPWPSLPSYAPEVKGLLIFT